jgi:hypothetical protein
MKFATRGSEVVPTYIAGRAAILSRTSKKSAIFSSVASRRPPGLCCRFGKRFRVSNIQAPFSGAFMDLHPKRFALGGAQSLELLVKLELPFVHMVQSSSVPDFITCLKGIADQGRLQMTL